MRQTLDVFTSAESRTENHFGQTEIGDLAHSFAS